MSDTPKLDLEERQRAQQVYEECCENPEDFAYNFVALQRELAQVQASWSATIEAAAQNDALLSRRIAELEPDAERYRWWLDHCNFTYLPSSSAAEFQVWVMLPTQERDKISAAIDAARAKEGK